MATEYVPKGTTDITSYFGASNVVIFAEGSQTVTTALDKSAVSIAQLLLQAGFSGTIGGGSSGPLIVDVDVSPGLVRNAASGGELNIKPGGNNTLITELEHLGPGRTNVMSGGTVTTLEQSAGRVNITSDVIVTNLRVAGGICTQQYKNSANTVLTVTGGQVYTAREITTGIITGGAYVQVRREDTSATVPTGGTISVYGGVLEWQGGNITTLNLYGSKSKIDLSKAPADLTIGTINGTTDALASSGIFVASGGTFKSTIGATITATTVNAYVGDVAFKTQENQFNMA